MRRNSIYLCIVSIILLLSGCIAAEGSRFLYSEGQAWQRQKCYTMPNQNKSKDCLNKTNMNYDDYKDKIEKSK